VVEYPNPQARLTTLHEGGFEMVTKTTASIAGALAMATSIAVGACGGSEKTTGAPASGPFSTGIAGTRTLDSLTASELGTLCDASAAFAKTIMTPQMSCQMGAIAFAGFSAMSGTVTDAQLQQSCSMIYGLCTAGGGSPTPADAGASTCTAPTGTCTATVAEYETCMNDTKTSLQQTMSAAPTCETLTVAWVQANSGDAGSSASADPPSCQIVKSKCPGWQPSGAATGP
jgi:hypothetical protein